MTSDSSRSSTANLSPALQWGTLIAIIGTLIVNTWSNLAPPQGRTIGDLANTVFRDVLIIPANYAFAIWGLIYLGLLAYGIYQLRVTQQDRPILQAVDYSLIVACIAQIAWIFLFLYEQFWLSVIAMLAILVPLIVAYLQIRPNQRRWTRTEKWCVQRPFSLYLGWISVATIVNIAIALFTINWNGWGLTPETWTIIMMAIATVIGAILAVQYLATVFTGVIIWALIAIAVAQSAATASISFVAYALAAILLIVWAVALFRDRNQRPSHSN